MKRIIIFSAAFAAFTLAILMIIIAIWIALNVGDAIGIWDGVEAFK